MALIHGQVKLAAATGLPADDVLNTWNFDGDEVDWPDVAADLIQFYNDMLHAFISSDISRAPLACQVRIFTPSIITGVMGPARLIVPFTLDPPGPAVETRLPEEVAVALSFHADKTDPRQRGRVFCGPLNQLVMQSGGGGNLLSRVDPDFCTNLGISAEAFRVDNEPDHPWVVWSRADLALYEVTGGWVDNAFDTIRSRGERATVRTTWGT
jgi:hypothetical protein